MRQSPTDVSNRYCFEGSIGYSPIVSEDFVRIRSRISIVSPSSAGSLEDGRVVTQSNVITVSPEFAILIVVPTETRQALDDAIFAAIGMTPSEFESHPNCESMIHLLPNIEYNILGNSDNDVAVNVMLEPRDYVEVFPDFFFQRCYITVQGLIHQNYGLANSFLKIVGMHIDYFERRVGFCEPL